MLFSNNIVLNLPLESFAVVLNDNVPMRWHHGSVNEIAINEKQYKIIEAPLA